MPISWGLDGDGICGLSGDDKLRARPWISKSSGCPARAQSSRKREPMSGYKFPDLQERQNSSAAAKKAMLEKFRAASQDPAAAERQSARAAGNYARQVSTPGR